MAGPKFYGCEISSGACLLPYLELDDTLALSALARDALSEVRRGKNGGHLPTGLLHQSVFGRYVTFQYESEAHYLRASTVFAIRVDQIDLANDDTGLFRKQNSRANFVSVRRSRPWIDEHIPLCSVLSETGNWPVSPGEPQRALTVKFTDVDENRT